MKNTRRIQVDKVDIFLLAGLRTEDDEEGLCN